MKRVLIVDDAIDLGRLFQDALKTAHPGISVSVVPSAEEALLESIRLTIDLLVTDIRLPGMTGFELVRKIRVRQPQVKVLMITGMTLDSSGQKQVEESHVDVFRRKPLGSIDFLRIADELLGFIEPEQSEGTFKSKTAPLPTTVSPSRDDDTRKAMTSSLPGGAADQKAAEKQTGAAVRQAVPETSKTGLSARLSSLRISLGALAVYLLDERGHIMAQTGDLPEAGMLEGLISPVAAALSAATQVSYQLGRSSAETVQAYRGQLVDLVVTPVGQYALLLVLRPGGSGLRLALAFEEALTAQADLSQTLEGMGLRLLKATTAAAPETMPTEMGPTVAKSAGGPEPSLATLLSQDPGLQKWEALVKQKPNGEMKPVDVDSFWEKAVSRNNGDDNAPGTLNYVQALKLGLLPDNE